MEVSPAIGALLLCLVSFATADNPDGFDESVCKPPPNNGGRSFPTFPNDFLSKLEWNDHVARKSLFMEEFISDANNIGAVYIWGFTAPGIVTKYITQADTNELFIIYDAEPQEFQDGNCVVKPMSDKDEFVLPFRKDPKIPGSDTLLPGSSLLTLGANPVGNMMFNGTELMNGIPCDVWYGCLFIPSGQITINVKYHFSRNDSDAHWYTAGGSTSAPIGIHASGVSATEKDFSLEQTFNYIYFSDKWPSQNPEYFAKRFETPEHAFCPGRQNVFDLPAVPQQFSFRGEIIDQLTDQITYVREWYDFNSNYSRMDFKSPPTGNDSVDVTISPQTIINDFNTGVSYIIDKFTRACTAIPITGGEFDSLPLGPLKTRMRTPKEFFDFDQSDKYPWQYMGEHLVRNTAANGWISYRPYPNEDSPLNATWEWFFATKATVIKAQDLVEDLEPLRAVVKSTQANLDVTYNIYRFSENSPDNKVFDVRNCYESSGSLSFDMQLEGNWTSFNAENNLQLLEYWFTLSVEAFAGVRAIRVTDVEFKFYGKRIAVQFTLLGPAPIKGDVDNKITQVSIGDAKDRLVEAFTDGIFQVYFMPDPVSGTTVFTPVANTLRVVERREHPSGYRPPKEPIKASDHTVRGPGMDGGAAAGLGIGMIVVGAVLAGVGILVYKKMTGPVSYPRTRLENDEN